MIHNIANDIIQHSRILLGVLLFPSIICRNFSFGGMKISLEWISDFVDFTESDPSHIAEVLTERAAEVDEIIMKNEEKEALQNVVVGKIMKVAKHSNADTLWCAQVDVGNGKIHHIVCGGSNLKEGECVPVALPGANLWGEIKIKKIKIRGEESDGMICSPDELHMGASENKEIYLLGTDAPVGKSFFDYQFGGDTVLDIENTTITNRPDLFSYIGFAREVAACGLGKLRKTKGAQNFVPLQKKIPKTKLPIQITIPKDADICPRYLAVYLTGVDGNASSPEWMQKRLNACDIRPISAIVDITNYVMLEYGAPNHAFDAGLVGKQWKMRLAKKGETMKTLDGETRKLTPETIVFEDEKSGIFDLCGVMGGESSAVQKETTNLLLHFPVYDPVRIRRTALNVGPRTDASGIYEKSVPPVMAEQGLMRALELFLDIFPDAQIASEIMDQKNIQEKKRIVAVPIELIDRIAGVKIKDAEIKKILTNLGFGVEVKKNSYAVTIPEWRQKDICIPEDVVEEVMRIYGLNTIPETSPAIEVRMFSPERQRQLEKSISQVLTRNECHEIVTLNFLGGELLKRSQCDLFAPFVTLQNPISEDLSLMRPALLPRLLETAEKNRRYRENFRIFESGNVFYFGNNKKKEDHRITALLVGEGFLAAKSLAQVLCAAHGWKARVEEAQVPLSFEHPGKSAVLKVGKSGISISQLHPSVSKEFDLPTETSFLSLQLSPLAVMKHKAQKMKALPRFQEIPFDRSVLCDRKMLVQNLVQGLTKLDDRIAHSEVMEVWEGEGIPEGQKSVTLSFEFRASDRTLTDTERDEIWTKILKELKKRGATVRFEK